MRGERGGGGGGGWKHHALPRFEIGASTGSFHTRLQRLTADIFYYGALDHVIETLHEPIQSTWLGMYQNLEELVLKVCKGE